MKKFMFSAVALIGFTVASYGANTVDVNENSNTTLVSDTPCADEWETNMIFLQSAFNATYEEALVLADRVFDECLRTRYGN